MTVTRVPGCCEFASCTRPAAVRSGGWFFCAGHARPAHGTPYDGQLLPSGDLLAVNDVLERGDEAVAA